MKLHTATRLGLYATLELAREPDRTLSSADLAERFGVSSHHLAKVLRTLSAAGLVQEHTQRQRAQHQRQQKCIERS